MRKISPRTILILVAVVLVAVFGLRGFFGPSAADKAGKDHDIAPVTVATVEARDVPVYAQAVGTVMANATVQVKSRIDGQIVAAGFKEGQLVRKGELLFQIDRAPYEAALRAAQANLQRDQAQLANARLNLGRANSLVKKGYVSQQTRDGATADAKALAGSVAADQAAVDQAQLQLGYTEIRSPVDGKTGPILVDAGNIVKANDAGALVVVTQIQPVKISFALAQQNLPKLQARMSEQALVASLKAHDDGEAKDITAPIDFIANTVNPTSGTIELRATYDNPDMRLVPGEFVDVHVRLDDLKSALTVPRDAVNTGQTGLYVYVVAADKTVEMRNVTLLYQDTDIAVVEGELKPGETVVTDGQLRITPGARVKIVSTTPNAVNS
ncbi:MAG: efflux RND transporter periplasmic adaptor subunit [Parvibaculum sp.]|uniref:efflux RND transporter periplasmic adaptor subunit n=1 Tax=Parvibaculum sp. TaxID=2024848 RepID=UPI0025FF969F|nr:efflux RND transporter periplasmic adaptor subunit [Parvibaculum sp.]MCE9649062.1 efflux RND transporter periplasmic adaptor subunit [Parvibaculum sp.]